MLENIESIKIDDQIMHEKLKAQAEFEKYALNMKWAIKGDKLVV